MLYAADATFLPEAAISVAVTVMGVLIGAGFGLAIVFDVTGPAAQVTGVGVGVTVGVGVNVGTGVSVGVFVSVGVLVGAVVGVAVGGFVGVLVGGSVGV
jgi:hypothetical protein